MNYYSILLAAVFGAIGGGIGALLGRKIENKSAKAAVTILPIVVMIQLGPWLVRKTSNSAEQRAAERVEGDPALLAAIQGQSPTGMKRLAPEDLREWNRLRIALSAVSPTVCAESWTGKLTNDDLSAALGKLSKADQDKWNTITAQATHLEAAQQKFEPPPEAALQEALGVIAINLSDDDKAKLGRALSGGQNAGNDDACFAITALMNYGSKLQGVKQEQFLRTLASL